MIDSLNKAVPILKNTRKPQSSLSSQGNHPGKKTDNPKLSDSPLHPRNAHRGRYDFTALCEKSPELKPFLKNNPHGDKTIDFSDSQAVLRLNKALLSHYYNIQHWQIPEGYLCPPIPGRADYIHFLADLLAGSSQEQTDQNTPIPTGRQINVLDIGTGANCIYPIIGSQSYGWRFTASDVDPVSVSSARLIVESNACLKNKIKLIQQHHEHNIFKGIINSRDRFDLTLCNPPFHASMAEAQSGSRRKWRNINNTQKQNPQNSQNSQRNFGGQNAELWCEGGEITFLKRMIIESREYSEQVCWFTSLVSKGDNIRPLRKLLQQEKVMQVEVVTMSQGQKTSRFIAWSFFTASERKNWAERYWHKNNN